jgi:uncharacterized protein (TIGR02145 family)
MRQIFLTIAAGFAAFCGMGQTMNVHKNDGSVTSINLTDIDRITFTVTGEGAFTDSRDGHVYRMLTYGTQVWMGENLAWLPSVNHPDNGSETLNRYYVYAYQGTSVSAAKDSANFTTYGVLYNWIAASTACPSGWHLPSDAEWTILRTYMGGDSGIKAKSTTGWDYSGNGDNSSGWNGRPAGCRFKDGSFKNLHLDAYYWSITESGTTGRHWNTYLSYSSDDFGRDNRESDNGFSVRCIRD